MRVSSKLVEAVLAFSNGSYSRSYRYSGDDNLGDLGDLGEAELYPDEDVEAETCLPKRKKTIISKFVFAFFKE